jgi:hypothetical protein
MFARTNDGVPAEIQTPAHRNLIGRSMTVLPPVLSPSSILPPFLSLGALILAKGKIREKLQKFYLFQFFCFLKNCVSEIA